MAEVIDSSLSHLTKNDRKAIAAYVMSLPSVESVAYEHKPRQKKPKTKNDYESQRGNIIGGHCGPPPPWPDIASLSNLSSNC